MTTQVTDASMAAPSPSAAKSAGANGKQRASTLGTLLFFGLIVLLLIDGWRNRIYNDISAENGVGYALGIIGGTMMLLLLLYPLRKRWKAMRALGAVKHWFRLHMMLGVLGPTAVLYHANFHLGSLNSNVALFCMTIVASSGLLGRYFYARIHHGLYGRQASLLELRTSSSLRHDQLAKDFSDAPELLERLNHYEEQVSRSPEGLLASARYVLSLSLITRRDYGWLVRQCRQSIARRGIDHAAQRRAIKQVQRDLSQYLSAVRQASQFTFYTRLFGLWHVLHLPLFVMMVITGIVHVIYVHMY